MLVFYISCGVFGWFDGAEATTCTAATCEDSADADDLTYLEENDLTLYCDSKCADTGSDEFGGLWCNMRGLGQLCRACRADK